MNYYSKMNDCSKMSDFEICKAVGDAIGLKWAELDQNYNGLCYWKDGDLFVFNPIRDPAESWPIIINNKISIINAGDEWLCVPDGETVDGWTGDSVDCIWHSRGCVDKNPLRAAMIVFLMMQEKSDGS